MDSISEQVELTTASERQPSNIQTKIINGNGREYTVDGLKLKPEHVNYYETLKKLIDSIIMYISKELNMQQYAEVYSLGRQLYELLRSIFIDEPFMRWLKLKEEKYDENFNRDISTTIETSLKDVLSNKDVLKLKPFKKLVLDSLNKEFHCENDATENYIKPECLVLTYNCCNLHFKNQ
ncbi:hypothetical protein [Parapoynx stagnalis nucleopolyhedrovirus]|uniref:Uncharacterized protein n=1 Tax=Parapoynx stagnalis nucleopolyhedrovirus TaxID=2993413 RepID=A0A9E7Y6V6_9ABAC|nr:hypothetical protein [Parapoynx stagnalis nucleopolyhedrovirus]